MSVAEISPTQRSLESTTGSPATWFSVIKVTGKDPAREKSFEEARTTVITVMRELAKDELMEEWTESLRSKYGLVVHRDRLVNAFRPRAQTESN